MTYSFLRSSPESLVHAPRERSQRAIFWALSGHPTIRLGFILAHTKSDIYVTVLSAMGTKLDETSDEPLAPMTPMQRLKRVFAIDIKTCLKVRRPTARHRLHRNPNAITTILVFFPCQFVYTISKAQARLGNLYANG